MPRLPLSFKPKELLAVLLPVWSPPKARLTSPIKRRSDNTHLPVTNCGERKPPLAGKRSDHCSSGIEPRRCSYKVRHMSSMKIGGVSLTGICSDPRHPASLPKRLAALFALVIVVCRSEGVLVVKFITDRECHQFCARLRICDEVRGDILTGSQASSIRNPSKVVQPQEIGIFVRSTAGLIFREKYSFLTLHPLRSLS
jgi:hypothetical protein